MDALDPLAFLEWLFLVAENRYGTTVAWIVTAIAAIVIVAVLVGLLVWMFSNPPSKAQS